nr:MAG TPA: hypothetical protein [Caudoviricetes sp.]
MTGFAGIPILERHWNSPPTSFFHFIASLLTYVYAFSLIDLYTATLCAFTIRPRKARREPTFVLEAEAP